MRSTTLFLLASSAIIGVTGCKQGVTEYVADSSGRLHPVAHYRDMWEHTIEDYISKEMNSDPPPAHCKTWREFWQRWYAARIADAHGERWGADVVAKARALRKAHGLDPY
ncbi:MAG: hypothetical protein DME51_13610 [Verrucomicrobia bacterium]|nr:MAG: hypothetical protein DME51_13610 [Verrucomicrobiota bacterium]